MKTCSKCHQEKPFSDFYKYRNSKDGYKPRCKTCQLEDQKKYVSENRDKVSNYHKEYRQKNKEKLLENTKKWSEANPDKRKEAYKRYRQKNKEKIRAQKAIYNQRNKESNAARYQEWKEKNKERLAAKDRAWYEANKTRKAFADKKRRKKNLHITSKADKKRYYNDEIFYLKKVTRARILSAFRRNGYRKNTKTARMIGCSFEALKTHIEKQFSDGMNWSNRGQWHIDHIIPLASATTKEEIISLCHYSNLQPLWGRDNMSKGAKHETA